ncbi:hypothetical protein GCM10011608_32350 [Micromonospora sonchi]|uniref:Uncharacterized protein n=1 Tax=Micromonospora sonchi TaxID=1763543 RepID=A0A917WZZ3_9ACTN|nr:hypothetical protein [Micromonospora sonchi]GGM45131.1 hypothetical protein GCM10011608_32350 [Micromonospora sonchi]
MWPFKRRAKHLEPPTLRVDPAEGDPTARALREAAQRRDWHTIRDLLTWQYINSDDPVQQFTAWREDARAAVS